VGLNISQACVEHRLDSVEIKLREGSAVSVVLASAGYPGAFEKGKKIAIEKVPTGMFLSLSRYIALIENFQACRYFTLGPPRMLLGIF
jgi:phosphoribosylamine-glycine ligase